MAAKKRAAAPTQDLVPVKRIKRDDSDASNAVEPAPLTLMTIPREMRDAIWEEVVCAAGVICRWAPNLSTRCPCGTKFVNQRMSVRSKALTVFQVNKQVYQEAMRVFFLRNRFAFGLHELHSCLPLVLDAIPKAREVTVSFNTDPVYSAMLHMYECDKSTYFRKPADYYRCRVGSWTEIFLSPIAEKLAVAHRVKYLKIVLRSEAGDFYVPERAPADGNKGGAGAGDEEQDVPWNTRTIMKPFENIRGLPKLMVAIAHREDLSEDDLKEVDSYLPALFEVVKTEPGASVDKKLTVQLETGAAAKGDAT